jgi:Tfp pilus assembly protein FimV
MYWFLLLVLLILLLFVLRPSLKRRINLNAQPGAADPLREAEVYLAYGRTEQAISLLEEALREHPQRTDIAEKLRSLKSR